MPSDAGEAQRELSLPHGAPIPTFTIVTPSFNSGRFINSTIASVVTQSGRFRIRYHVQDGGSRDDTVRLLQDWKQHLVSGGHIRECCGVEFSYSSTPDKGMYDAIQAGFANCGVSVGSYMTWINSDDILMPGALSCVARMFQDFPDAQWIGGIPCQIDEDGAITRIHDQRVYPQSTLEAGLHDGRHLPFVMQEGTVWRAELWLKTGGLRTSLRLAGDFDLWRRFAVETPYVSAETLLAAHRRRAGQLTEDSAPYYAELDSLIQAYAQRRDREWERYQHWRARSAFDRDQSFLGTVLSCETGKWALEQRSLPALFNTTICLSAKGAARSVPAQYVSGFSEETHQYPHINVPKGSRLLREGMGVVQFDALTDGSHRLRVRLRSFSEGVVLRIRHGEHGLFEGTLPLTRHDRDCEITVDTEFRKGTNKVDFISDPKPGGSPEFLITVCEAAPGP